MGVKDILSSVLDEISLSEDELLKFGEVAKSFISLLKTKGIDAYVGGSFAKGTVIRTKELQDVDIFVVFDYSEDVLKLANILKKLKLPGKLKRVHGSRDYFQIVCPGVVLELIPVVKNEDPERAENVTDVSLSHVKYIKGEIRKNKAIADEIRLAKAFCRAQRCYGAESYIRGFSGYSLEVLVIHFGGFVKFLKNIGKKRVLDPLKYFKSEREVLMELNSSKLQGPIVLIDPTHKYRNVSAGLGGETFEKFLKVKDDFLKKPSPEFFERKKFDIDNMKSFAKKKKAKFIELDLFTKRQEGDIAGTKMKKFLDFFASELGRKQQLVLKKDFDYLGIGQKAKGYLIVIESPEIEIRGPHAKMNEASEAFKKAKGKEAYEKKGYLWFKEKTNINKIFKEVSKVEMEMGAGGKLI
jgi:tRNA nucleotidyltransferase (CCA-adding enzyme)